VAGPDFADAMASEFGNANSMGAWRFTGWIQGQLQAEPFIAGNRLPFYLGGSFCRLLVCKDDSFVLGCTNPPLMPLLIWLASCLRRRDYVLFLLDVYPTAWWRWARSSAAACWIASGPR